MLQSNHVKKSKRSNNVWLKVVGLVVLLITLSGVSVAVTLMAIGTFDAAEVVKKKGKSVGDIFEAEKIANLTSNKRKHKYKINVHHALSQIKDNIVRFMMKTSIEGLSQLMINKISQVTNAYRENRKCDRSEKRMSKNKYPTAYKRLC